MSGVWRLCPVIQCTCTKSADVLKIIPDLMKIYKATKGKVVCLYFSANFEEGSID